MPSVIANTNSMLKKTLVFAALLLILGHYSCRKYPDGPTMLFWNPKKLITGFWEVKKYYVNGIDSITQYSNLYYGGATCGFFINEPARDVNHIEFHWNGILDTVLPTISYLAVDRTWIFQDRSRIITISGDPISDYRHRIWKWMPHWSSCCMPKPTH